MAEVETTPNTNEQKPKKGLIVGIIAAVVVVILAIVCVAMTSAPKVIGKYKISAFITDGKESTEMVDLLNSFGGEYTIEFRKDKTGTLKMGAGESVEETEFVWNDKELTAKDSDGEESSIPYEYKDDTVTITIEEEGMKFTREK